MDEQEDTIDSEPYEIISYGDLSDLIDNYGRPCHMEVPSTGVISKMLRIYRLYNMASTAYVYSPIAFRVLCFLLL